MKRITLPSLMALFLLIILVQAAQAQTLDDFGQEIDSSVYEDPVFVGMPPPAQWIPPAYASVRAYLYNLKDEKDAPVFHDGKLDKTVVNKKGILLRPEQVQALLIAISPPDRSEAEDASFCHVPHHGFVFYDEAGKVVAHFSPCLICKTMEISPPLKYVSPSYPALKRLIKDLGLPVFGNLWDARKYKK